MSAQFYIFNPKLSIWFYIFYPKLKTFTLFYILNPKIYITNMSSNNKINQNLYF